MIWVLKGTSIKVSRPGGGGGGQKLQYERGHFLYLNHPTKYDVTSGRYIYKESKGTKTQGNRSQSLQKPYSEDK